MRRASAHPDLAECERLQALPDGWTDLGPDSRRYAALGDAVTASVAEWIGLRLLGYVGVSQHEEGVAG